MSNIKNSFELLRPRQWLKNALIMFPLVFSGHLMEANQFFAAIITTIAFCSLVSSVYIFNDLSDILRDEHHPVKKNRPLTAKKISPEFAQGLAGVLLIVGLSMGLMVGKKVAIVMLLYLFLHFIYNWRVRDWVVVDVLLIALGFQLRIWAGSMAVGVLPTVWLELTVFLLSLFIGFIKRRGEILTLQEKAPQHRLSLSGYQLLPLDMIIILLSVIIVVSYVIYTFSRDLMFRVGNDHMFLSSVFVLFAVGRYLYLVYATKQGEDAPELILKDFPLLLNIFLWSMSIYLIMYLHL